MRSWFVPMPLIRAPSVLRKRHRPWTCGSLAAFRITVSPSASTAAITVFSVPVTLISSRKTSVPRKRPSSVRWSDGPDATRAPSSLSASRWVSSRRRPIRSPPGGGSTAWPVRASRPGASSTEPRSCDITAGSGSRPLSVLASRRTVPWSSTSTRTPRWRSPSSSAVTSRMRGTLSTTTWTRDEQAGREHGQGLVLVAGRRHRPPQGMAALHQEAISGHVSLLVNTNRACGH